MNTEIQKSTDIKVAKKEVSWRKMCLKRNKDLYFMLIPGLIFLIVFKYTPMYGIIIAFLDYNIFAGIGGSEWIGMNNFIKLFGNIEFYQVFTNTLLISIYKLVFYFPIPILLAIVLNEVRSMAYKKTVQTIIYLPHFLSWVIVSGLCINILSTSNGIINNLIVAFGGTPISFMMSNDWFRTVIVGSSIWKEAGWGTIIYIAAIAGIDQEIYEAARVDGAGRIRQIMHITLPGLTSTIVLLFIMRLGNMLDAGTEQILMLYNPVVYDSGDVIGTYVYRMGIGKMDYSFSTSVGLFESIIGFILVVTGNSLSRKLVHKSIW